MQPNSQKYRWDALNAGELIDEFVEGKIFENYSSDSMLKAAVERELEIVGEALSRAV